MAKGFQQSSADCSLMTKKTKEGSFIALLIYVDDVLLRSNDLKLIEETKGYLDEEFKIKDIGCAKYFLGFVLARSIAGNNFSQ